MNHLRVFAEADIAQRLPLVIQSTSTQHRAEGAQGFFSVDADLHGRENMALAGDPGRGEKKGHCMFRGQDHMKECMSIWRVVKAVL